MVTSPPKNNNMQEQSKAFGKVMIDDIPDGYVETDLAGNIITFNETFSAILDYPPEELMKMNYQDLMDKENAQIFYENCNKAYETNTPRKGFQYEIITKSGIRKNLEASIRAGKDDAGAVSVLRSIIRDVTGLKKAEATLRTSEALYRRLTENIEDIIWVIDLPSRKFTYISSSVQRVLGFSIEEFTSKDALGFMLPASIPVVEQAIRIAVSNPDKTVTIDYESYRKDGLTVWLEAIGHPVLDASGAIVGMQGVSRDITARKKAEGALRKSEEQYRLVAENMGDVVWVVDTRASKYIYISPSVERLTGYTSDEYMAMHPNDILTSESAARIWKYFKESLDAAGAGLPVKCPSIEIQGTRKDGSSFWEEVTYNLVYDDANRVVALQGTTRDITDRKIAEEALRASELKYRLLTENMTDLLVIADIASLKYLYANPSIERLIGYCPEEMLNKTVDQLVPPEYVTKLQEYMSRAIAALEADRPYIPSPFETPVIRKDGATIWIEATFRLIRDNTGAITATQAVGRDITERKRLEIELAKKTEELVRSNVELEQFAYIASHDLQEPLRMVASFTELLAKHYKGRLDKDADEFITFIMDGTIRMKQLINDLLAYSRVGTTGNPFKPINCRDVLDRAIMNLSIAIQENNAKVDVGKLPIVMGDEGQLMQLFQNLIANAIKFRGVNPPVVQVCVRQEGTNHVFSIADNGIGIEGKDFNRIFEAFQRAHGRKNYPGTGIGLAVCKKIVERHGGHIWVESTPGKGSVFSFTLSQSGGNR